MKKDSRGKGPEKCRRKFLRYFRDGFRDETYVDWERGYKERAHTQWLDVLDRAKFKALLGAKQYSEIAAHAVRIESPANDSTALRSNVNRS